MGHVDNAQLAAPADADDSSSDGGSIPGLAYPDDDGAVVPLGNPVETVYAAPTLLGVEAGAGSGGQIAASLGTPAGTATAASGLVAHADDGAPVAAAAVGPAASVPSEAWVALGPHYVTALVQQLFINVFSTQVVFFGILKDIEDLDPWQSNLQTDFS